MPGFSRAHTSFSRDCEDGLSLLPLNAAAEESEAQGEGRACALASLGSSRVHAPSRRSLATVMEVEEVEEEEDADVCAERLRVEGREQDGLGQEDALCLRRLCKVCAASVATVHAAAAAAASAATVHAATGPGCYCHSLFCSSW